MDHPPPHSFSSSPVEEVFCRCSLGPDDESLSLAVPPPYPGWPLIRDAIRDMITGPKEISRITGCMLRYTDLVPVPGGVELPGTEEIERLLSGRFNCVVEDEKGQIMTFCTNIPDTAGSVASIRHRPEKPGWTLVFTIETGGVAGFGSFDAVLEWFDDAHSLIHGLFDLIVPEEMVGILR